MKKNPKKAVVLYDGECDFCAKWVKYMRKLTGDTIEYIPYQEGCKLHKEVSLGACHLSVQLIDENRCVHSGMEAVYWLLYQSGHKKWLYKWYLKSQLFKKLSDAIYRGVARVRCQSHCGFKKD